MNSAVKKRWQNLQRALQKAGKNGTVGCVAMDKDGNLAAATSTGGMNNKRYGRVGDVPVIGAGTYANNNTCAVSATGHGEYFIRYTVAHDISALMEYKDLPLAEAARNVVNGKLSNKAGNGGIIAVDKDGNITLEMNSAAMFRGWARSNGEEGSAVFKGCPNNKLYLLLTYKMQYLKVYINEPFTKIYQPAY